MEVGLLNLMSPIASGDDAAVPGATDPDAFAKLIAQLGLAPGSTEAAQETPEALAAKLATAIAAGAKPASSGDAADGSAAQQEEGEEDGTDAPADTTLDPAMLGLPPFLAAQVMPATAAAPASGAMRRSRDATGNLPAPGTATTEQLPQPAPDAAVPVSPMTPEVKLPTEKSAAVELPAPLAALASNISRRPGATTSPPGAEPQGRPSSPAMPAIDVAPIATTQFPPVAGALVSAPSDAAPATATLEPIPTAEVMLERQLDLARGGEWLDQLAKDIARTASGEGQLRFKLNPEHLGSLHVELTQGAGGASVRLTADTEAARNIIADARPQLIAEARAQGVRITEAHVDLGSGGQTGGGGGTTRDGRATPDQTYLTTWKPESAEENNTPPRRSASERYA